MWGYHGSRCHRSPCVTLPEPFLTRPAGAVVPGGLAASSVCSLFSFHQILVSGSRDKLEGLTSGRQASPQRQVDVARAKSGLGANVHASTGKRTVPQADCPWTSMSEHGKGEKDGSRGGTSNTRSSVSSLIEEFMRIILITTMKTIESVSRIGTKCVFR